MSKKPNTRYLQPSNFEKIVRLASGLSRDEMIALIKALTTGLGAERLFTGSEVRQIVEWALAHQKQREPLLRGVGDMAAELRRIRPMDVSFQRMGDMAAELRRMGLR